MSECSGSDKSDQDQGINSDAQSRPEIVIVKQNESDLTRLKILDVVPEMQAAGSDVVLVVLHKSKYSSKPIFQLQVDQGAGWQTAVSSPCDYPLGTLTVIRAQLRSWPPLLGDAQIRLRQMWVRDPIQSQEVPYTFCQPSQSSQIRLDIGTDKPLSASLSQSPTSSDDTASTCSTSVPLTGGQTQSEFHWLCKQIPDAVFEDSTHDDDSTKSHKVPPLRSDILRRILDKKTRGLLALTSPNGTCHFQKHDCILMGTSSENKSGLRMDIANFASKCMPQALTFKLFRDASFPFEEWQSLRRLPICMYGYAGPSKSKRWQNADAICVNPFHYEIFGKLPKQIHLAHAVSEMTQNQEDDTDSSSSTSVSSDIQQAAVALLSQRNSTNLERLKPMSKTTSPALLLEPKYSQDEIQFLCDSIPGRAILGQDPKRAAPKPLDLIKRLLDKTVVGKFVALAEDGKPAFQTSTCVLVSCHKTRSAVRMDVANYAAKSWPQALTYKLFRNSDFAIEEWQTLRKIDCCKYGYLGPKHGSSSGWPESSHICINPFHYKMFGSDDPKDTSRTLEMGPNMLPDREALLRHNELLSNSNKKRKASEASSNSTLKRSKPSSTSMLNPTSLIPTMLSQNQAISALSSFLQQSNTPITSASNGQALFVAGQSCDAFLIIAGIVELIAPNGSCLETVTTNGIIGCFSHAAREPQPFSAIAKSPISLFRIPEAMWQALAFHIPSLEACLQAIVTRRRQAMNLGIPACRASGSMLTPSYMVSNSLPNPITNPMSNFSGNYSALGYSWQTQMVPPTLHHPYLAQGIMSPHQVSIPSSQSPVQNQCLAGQSLTGTAIPSTSNLASSSS